MGLSGRRGATGFLSVSFRSNDCQTPHPFHPAFVSLGTGRRAPRPAKFGKYPMRVIAVQVKAPRPGARKPPPGICAHFVSNRLRPCTPLETRLESRRTPLRHPLGVQPRLRHRHRAQPALCDSRGILRLACGLPGPVGRCRAQPLRCRRVGTCRLLGVGWTR